MNCKVVKATSKGQITLPKSWRKKFDTENFMLEISNGNILVKPVKIQEFEEEVIFDAKHDNNGKGISPEKMIEMLKKIKNG